MIIALIVIFAVAGAFYLIGYDRGCDMGYEECKTDFMVTFNEMMNPENWEIEVVNDPQEEDELEEED